MKDQGISREETESIRIAQRLADKLETPENKIKLASEKMAEAMVLLIRIGLKPKEILTSIEETIKIHFPREIN